MTTPVYMGHALNPTATDLDLIKQTSDNAAATATTAAADAIAALVALTIVPTPALSRTTSTLQDYINNTATVWVKDFGVVGDGVADDTVAFQLALTQAAAGNRILFGGDAIIKVTSGVTMTGPGLVFESAPHGVAGGPGILVSGTLGGGGTPALTVTGQPCALYVTVRGTGQTANAVYFNNPQRCTVQSLRVYNFDGYGCKIDKCWDCFFHTISVELCGNASNYAFSMNDAGDSCNMTHITRLQVESANKKAIYLGGLCLSITIDSIHSEALRNPDNTVYAWELNGGSCSFNSSRFTSNATIADAKLFIRGANTDYTALRSEGCTAVLEGGGGAPITLISPTFGGGTVSELAGQTGALIIIGGDYGSWSGSTAHRYLVGASNSYLATTGGTMTGDLIIAGPGGGVTGSTRFRPGNTYKGTACSTGDTGVVTASGGTVELADGNTNAVLLIASDGGDGAIVLLKGGAHAVAVTALGGSPWSAVQGTAASTNVYWNGGSSTYRLENQNGANRTYFVWKAGQVPTA